VDDMSAGEKNLNPHLTRADLRSTINRCKPFVIFAL
jgi:hypothetical protein